MRTPSTTSTDSIRSPSPLATDRLKLLLNNEMLIHNHF